jgi:hypothetical protein
MLADLSANLAEAWLVCQEEGVARMAAVSWRLLNIHHHRIGRLAARRDSQNVTHRVRVGGGSV